MVSLFNDTFCERCVADFRQQEEQRRQHQAAAQRLGRIGARGSEIVGTALGAVGAASVAASQYFVHGAATGARHAWAGSAAIKPPPGVAVAAPAARGPAATSGVLGASPVPYASGAFRSREGGG